MLSPAFSFDAIGTRWQIDLPASLSPEQKEKLRAKIRERIDTFDKHYSRFRSDSLITEMSRNAGTYELPPDGEKMFSLYKKLYDITEGAFTPMIGNVLSDAGYDASYSLVPKPLSAPLSWDEAMEYDFPRLKIKKPVLLDLGAAGKGYLIDIIGELIAAEGIEHFCIDAGGDMLLRSPEPLRIGLEHPDNSQQAIGVATISEGSICGSAGNRRTWADFHHVISPHSLTSPRHIRAIWTVADSAMIADAMTTCLYFLPAEALLKEYNFKYMIVREDYSVEHSPYFPAELFN